MLVCSLGTKEAQESWGKDRRLKSGLMTALAELENLTVCTPVRTNYFFVIVLAVEGEGCLHKLAFLVASYEKQH